MTIDGTDRCEWTFMSETPDNGVKYQPQCTATLMHTFDDLTDFPCPMCGQLIKVIYPTPEPSNDA